MAHGVFLHVEAENTNGVNRAAWTRGTATVQVVSAPRSGAVRASGQEDGHHSVSPTPHDTQTVAESVTPAPAQNTAVEPVYLPRALLDKGPQPTEPVVLPYPATAPIGHWRARMALYIDAEGVVQRVMVQPSSTHAQDGEPRATLPPELEDSARQAYLQARFIPGERNGQAVACRMVVEVEFEASPMEAQAGEGVADQDSLKVATLSLR